MARGNDEGGDAMVNGCMIKRTWLMDYGVGIVSGEEVRRRGCLCEHQCCGVLLLSKKMMNAREEWILEVTRLFVMGCSIGWMDG